MQKTAKTIFWTLFLCAGCFLVTWNMRLLWSDSIGSPLVLSPETIEFPTAFSEGSEFQAEWDIENTTRSDLIVKKILSSCGCTGISTKEGEPIEVPMVLAPSKRFPILATVDTKGMEGERGVSVIVSYEYRGQPLFSVGNISFEVIPQKDADVPE